eukprot:Pgem_evm1s5399
MMGRLAQYVRETFATNQIGGAQTFIENNETFIENNGTFIENDECGNSNETMVIRASQDDIFQVSQGTSKDNAHPLLKPPSNRKSKSSFSVTKNKTKISNFFKQTISKSYAETNAPPQRTFQNRTVQANSNQFGDKFTFIWKWIVLIQVVLVCAVFIFLTVTFAIFPAAKDGMANSTACSLTKNTLTWIPTCNLQIKKEFLVEN